MADESGWLESLKDTRVPLDKPCEVLDIRELGPPHPLKQTLERLAELNGETVLVQVNDRAPQHLFPKLRDRGYEFVTVDEGEAVVTAIWRPSEE
jgi:TusA-related sulfurtransferase